jgi:hypothetical protein
MYLDPWLQLKKLHKALKIKIVVPFNPFTWWAKYENLDIGFFAHQMMDIVGL